MIDGSAVKEKMLSYISDSENRVFFDRDFAEMGGAEQVSSCLAELISEGALFEVSNGGVYTKKKYGNPHDYLFDVDDNLLPLGPHWKLMGRLK